MLDSYADSARTLTFAGIVVEGILTLLFVLSITIGLGLFAATTSTPQTPGTSVPAVTSGFLILILVGLAFGLVGLLWVFLDYFLVYKRIKEEDIRGAKDTSLILGIIQLILGGIIPGILLIVAHSQLNNSFMQSEFRKQSQV